MAAIFLRDLAYELGVDRSALRKFVLKAEIPMIRRRTDTNGHTALLLSESDAQRVRELRMDGASPAGQLEDVLPEEGWFYVIQVVPDLEPNRVKLGFATNVKSRLAEHQTSAPTACWLCAWPCRRSWEQAAIASVTREDSVCIRNEVFYVGDLEALKGRLKAFFTIMPAVAVRVSTP